MADLPTESDLVPSLLPSLVWLMAITCGLVAANLYYNQPLLVTIGHTFHIPDHWASLVATAPQVGYTLGMILLVPLGDMLERKRLILCLLIGTVVCLAVCAGAPSYGVLMAASLLLGICSAVPQLLLPMAAQLTAESDRGRIIGRIMSGLLIGILLSRTVSGYVGEQFGWRTVFAGAAGVGLGLTLLLAWKLPASQPTFRGGYRSLMLSLVTLVRELPQLQHSALVGGSIFAAFSVFWTTLVFFLESPAYRYGSTVAGLFGLVGALGALAAPLAGKLADNYGSRAVITVGICLTLLSYLVLGLAGLYLTGLIAGIILLDIGVQSAHIANQTLVFSLRPEARSRLNTVYMTGYFAGGSLGSVVGGLAWTHGGWNSVCVVGGSLLVLALVLQRSLGNQRPPGV
ncbi:MFS transporter [Spirosoma utsteinense]|uniref:MFS transporter n=1 Tax=Spirosoma utsteinense TaxID=2585773 RepID=UPI001ABD3615|nr:MFS transporter [Spirosoma utsteinense]MBC3787794.1 putative MFS family arabinose efflux permease [Spirosoma utsteinense]